MLFARGLRSMGAGDAATPTLGEPLTATALGVVAAVADALRDRTLSGDPPPGGRLREIELAREHGAARHSVRALAAERLVTIERGGRRRRRAAVNGSHGL